MSNTETMKKLSDNVEKLITDKRRGVWKIIIAKAFVLLFVVVYLSWAYSQTAKVDVDALTMYAQKEVYEVMPSMSTEVTDFLVSSAPDVVQTLIERSFEMIPEMRKLGEDNMNSLVDDSMKDFAGHTNTIVSTYLIQQKSLLDTAHPQMNDADKLSLLMAGIRDELNDTSSRLTANFEKSYVTYMTSLNYRLIKLTQNDDTLTETELLQKRLIETWMKLVRMKTSSLGEE